jgi:hypothetical protein
VEKKRESPLRRNKLWLHISLVILQTFNTLCRKFGIEVLLFPIMLRAIRVADVEAMFCTTDA